MHEALLAFADELLALVARVIDGGDAPNRSIADVVAMQALYSLAPSLAGQRSPPVLVLPGELYGTVLRAVLRAQMGR